MSNSLHALLFLVGALFWSYSQASFQETIDLTMTIKENGDIVSTPKMILAFGHSGSIQKISHTTGKGYFVEVSPSRLGAEAVFLQYKVGSVDEEGHKRILSTPELIVSFGKTAEVEWTSADDPQQVTSFSVLPILKRTKN